MTVPVAQITRDYAEKQIIRLCTANLETERKIVLREQDRLNNRHDPQMHNFYRGTVARMERTIKAREEAMADLASRVITGLPWRTFCTTVGGDYTPSVSIDEHGEVLSRVFTTAFQDRFGRPAYTYGLDLGNSSATVHYVPETKE